MSSGENFNFSNDSIFEAFEDLMPYRVQEILLVSSLYDSFILREDGRLNELLIGETLDLDLHQTPGVTHVVSGEEAMRRVAGNSRINLIVCNLHLADMDAAELARRVRASGLDIPVVVLAYDYREIKDFLARRPTGDIERIFLWQGSPRILIAIVKYVEDKRNAEHDTASLGVPVLLVVEDNIRYYSSFLPVIYTEIIEQSRNLLGEGLNAAHRLLRLRARPRILLCSDYETADELIRQYSEHLLAVISDVEFPRRGQLSADAGFQLAARLAENLADVPIVLHSSRAEFKQRAEREHVQFLQKRSPTLLADLRRFFLDSVGFGDFVFRLPDGGEVARARDMRELEELLKTAPEESIAYHGYRNHFSRWLRARTEFALAERLRPRRVADFGSIDGLRRDLMEAIADYRREQSRMLIGDFHAKGFQPTEDYFLRFGGGSLGGKARGLAFMRHLLHSRRIDGQFEGVEVRTPPTLALASDNFDRFLVTNNLFDFAMRCEVDDLIVARFLSCPLPTDLADALRGYLKKVRHPLAVRSSSLLEDSQYQPFTGVYQTIMLANSGSLEERSQALFDAVRRVWASTFFRRAKGYVRATPYRLEEEKMAVIIQKLTGAQHGVRFYPDFSGVARSRNFYPIEPMRAEEGVVTVALGLGRSVVDGGKALTFSPAHPHHLVQFSSVEDILANAQDEFWALAMDGGSQGVEREFTVDVAERDGVLGRLGSTYSADNDAVYDGLSRPGARLITFAPLLKFGLFPLPQILQTLMQAGEQALSRPIEMEFAVTLPDAEHERATFSFLQLRPLVVSREVERFDLDQAPVERLLCRSSHCLGQGRLELHEIVVVDYSRFERAASREVAEIVAGMNARLGDAHYLLIGVGRWGSNDPWLGIPVSWDQVSGARVIVESGFRDFKVTPSQGSHFFQNLTAFQVGYFTVNPGEDVLDWDWLAEQTVVEEQGCVRRLHLRRPVTVLMNGVEGKGMILKPEE